MAAVVSVCYLYSRDRKSYNAGFSRSPLLVGSVDHVLKNILSASKCYDMYIRSNI